MAKDVSKSILYPGGNFRKDKYYYAKFMGKGSINSLGSWNKGREKKGNKN